MKHIILAAKIAAGLLISEDLATRVYNRINTGNSDKQRASFIQRGINRLF